MCRCRGCVSRPGRCDALCGARPLSAVRVATVEAWLEHASGPAARSRCEGKEHDVYSATCRVSHDSHRRFRARRAVVENGPQTSCIPGAPRKRQSPEPANVTLGSVAARVLSAFTDHRAATVFLTLTLTLTLTGLRRFELQGLRWRDLSFTDRNVRVVESKSEEGERLIALARALEQHYAVSAFKADADYVFAHPQRGTRLESEWYAGEFRAGARRSRNHGLRASVPRRTPRGADEPRRGRCVTPGDHGDSGAPLARDNQAVREPGWRRLPRRGSPARAPHVRGTGNRYQRSRKRLYQALLARASASSFAGLGGHEPACSLGSGWLRSPEISSDGYKVVPMERRPLED